MARLLPSALWLGVFAAVAGGWRVPTSPRAAAVRHCSALRPRAHAPVALASSASRLGGHHSQHQSAVARGTALLALVLRPLRRLVEGLSRLVRAALGKLPAGGTTLLGGGAVVDVAPRAAVDLDGARSLANLVVVSGEATRSVPPANELLAYFNYRLSPFYAELPASASVAAPPSAGDEVRWLRHRHARTRSEFQLAADEGRLALLRELYEDAVAQERVRRREQFFSFGRSQNDDADSR